MVSCSHVLVVGDVMLLRSRFAVDEGCGNDRRGDVVDFLFRSHLSGDEFLVVRWNSTGFGMSPTGKVLWLLSMYILLMVVVTDGWCDYYLLLLLIDHGCFVQQSIVGVWYQMRSWLMTEVSSTVEEGEIQ